MNTRLSRRRLVGSTLAGGAGLAAAPFMPGQRRESRVAAATELNWAVNAFQPAEVELVQKVVDNFVAINPEYTINVLGYDPMTYDQKLMADVVAGTLPDIFVNVDLWTKPFFERGLTADLKPYMDVTGPHVEDFDPTFMELAMSEGRVGFLPRAGDVGVLFYNKRLFEEAGVGYPTAEWTYSDLLANAERLTKRADDGTTTQYGFTGDYEWWAQWTSIIVAEGGQILTDDNSAVAFNSEAGYRGWDVIFTGLRNGWFAPPNVQATMGGPMVPFATGTSAMAYFVRAGCPGFRAQLTDDWDVQLPPRGSVDRKTGMGTMGYAMSATTSDPEAAWAALHYLYTEGMKVFMESYLVVPPIISAYDDPAWKALPGPPHSNDVFVDAFQFAMLPPKLDFYNSGGFLKAIRDGIDAVVLGAMDTKTAVDYMTQEASKALTI